MIANMLNVLIGLGVTDVAIFGMPPSVPASWIMIVVGIAIVILALVARRSDFSGWQSATNIVLGLALLIVNLLEQVVSISPLVTFWIELWVGLTVASLALWAVLYHPREGADRAAAAR